MISHALLPFSVPVDSFQHEVELIREEWQPHFNTRQYEGDWTVLSLRSPGGVSDRIVPDEMGGGPFLDTPLMNECPGIHNWIQQLQCEVLSVRLLQLRSGAFIKEHRDHELSFEQGEARLHLPIFTNKEVWFHIDDVPLQMQEGECWYMNANLRHRVANNGHSARIHLVVDCKVNEWLKKRFEEAQKTNVKNDQSAAFEENIIRELRLQQNPAATALADELERKLKSRMINQ